MLLSRILSYVTHPILTVTYLLAFILFQKDSYLFYTITPNGRWFFLMVTVLLTVVAPLISVGYLIYTKQISSIYLDNRQERIIPMTISAAYTFGLYYLFLKFSMPPVIMTVIGVGVIGVIMTLLITLFWKISAHMMGISGISGAVLGITQTFQPVGSEVLVFLFVLSGFVGTARIKQDSHSLSQVLVGWLLGFCISYGAVIFLMNGALN
jgi:hypothetical protein